MTRNTSHLRALIERLARLDAAEAWAGDLNPSQAAALDYLARANRFSRAPSHVADYLGSTRGTISQTLKALVAKGMIAERRSDTDKRSISYDLTPAGRQTAGAVRGLSSAMEGLDAHQRAEVEQTLAQLLSELLEIRGGRPFGLCRTCRYHQTRDGAAYCGLLDVALTPEESALICHEQTPE